MLKLRLPFLLLILVSIIALTNFNPQTYLTGWDNLHPEFNIGLNINRSVFSSWQEYQGLGLAGGMGHAADLPRQIFLYLFSFILPENFLRYFYHFLMLLIGGLGVFILLKQIILLRFDNQKRELASLAGAIFYILNLATLQMFHTPFEPFSHHFAFLPWLFFANLNFLKKADKGNLILLFVINLLAVPQGYVATYFLVTVMMLGLMFVFYLVRTRELKKVIICFVLMFAVNSFWLFPNLYFLATKSGVNVNAKINQMSTENNFLSNKKYGNLENTAILKSFWFDNTQTDKDGNIDLQMKAWIPHFNNPFIISIGYLLFIISVIGMVFSVRKKIYEALFFLPVFIFSFAIISNDTLIFSQIAGLFYKLPLFSQIFRFPFTKFAIALAFSLSIFYAVAAVFLINLIKSKKIGLIIFLTFSFLPILFMFPVFQGKFFEKENQVKIPKSYFQVFDFFKKQDKTGRIANFPQYSFWGWSFYRWGYQGSGLWWYGVEQPILDRAFDVWSKEDEGYYNEISYAVKSNNKKLFDDLLEKYQIRWLLVDDSIMSYSSQKQIYFSKLQEIINNSSIIKLDASFDKIKIYKVNLSSNINKNIFLENNLVNISPTYNWTNYDRGYVENNNYFSSKSNNNVYYPFRSLFTNKNQEDLEFKIEDKGDYFSFQAKVPKDLVGATLTIPEVYKDELQELNKDDLEKNIIRFPQILIDNELVLSQIQINDDSMMDAFDSTSTQSAEVFLPYIKEGNLEVRIPKVNGLFSYNSNIKDFYNMPLKNCNVFSKGKIDKKLIKNKGAELIELTSMDGSNCFDLDIPNLSHRLSYLVTVESQYKEGKNLLFAVGDKKYQRSEIETNLPKSKNKTTSFFIVPPGDKYGIGYIFHFDNVSIGRVKTVNDLGKINVSPIPYRFLTALKIVKKADAKKVQVISEGLVVEHPNPSLYKINFSLSTVGGAMSFDKLRTATPEVSNATLILSQAFDEGWKAYSVQSSKFKVQSFLNTYFPFFFGKEIKDHVLVNNWENGWLIKSQISNLNPPAGGQNYNSNLKTNESSTMEQLNNKTIVLVFWPQYLEFLGFVLLGGTLIWLVIVNFKKPTRSADTSFTLDN